MPSVVAASPRSDDIAGYARHLLDQARQLSRGTLHHRTFRTRGVTVQAWFTDPAYAATCERNIATGVDAGSPKDISVYLLDAASLGWPAPVWRYGDHNRMSMNEALADNGLRGSFQVDPVVWQVYAPDDRLGVQLIARPGAAAPWESGSPLRNFIHWGASAAVRFCHAGTLGRDGRGLLLAGGGGAGKSGTTLAGIAAGLTTVGDDYCLVTLGATVEAFPIFRILKQDPDGVRRVFGPDAGARFGATNWQGKWEIHASELNRTPFVERLEIKAIVLPKVAGAARSTIRAVPAAQAMRAVLPSNILQLPDGEAEGVRFTADLCRRLPAFERRPGTG